MGQRNMTYVITDGDYNGVQVNTIYNQWNFVKLQAWKLKRTIEYFKKVKSSGDSLFKTFFAVHGLSPESGWVGGNVSNKEYKEYDMQPFEEDNNNGWVIVKLTQGGKFGEYDYHIELCCIWGSEDDRAEKTTYKPVETKRYFSIERGNMKGKPEQLAEYDKAVEYIAANTTYNPNLKKEAVKLIKQQLIKETETATN